MTLKEWCIENDMMYLINEWDYEKNAPLTPDDVSYGTNDKVYWKCSINHSWPAAISSRTGYKKAKCPYCGNKRIKIGFNDLETWSKENGLDYIIDEFGADTDLATQMLLKYDHYMLMSLKERKVKRTHLIFFIA